jgi:hypothetical protein
MNISLPLRVPAPRVTTGPAVPGRVRVERVATYREPQQMRSGSNGAEKRGVADGGVSEAKCYQCRRDSSVRVLGYGKLFRQFRHRLSAEQSASSCTSLALNAFKLPWDTLITVYDDQGCVPCARRRCRHAQRPSGKGTAVRPSARGARRRERAG